jgi:hypothetical protein
MLSVEQPKTMAYSDLIQNEKTLDQPNLCACDTMYNRLGSLDVMRLSTIVRIHACTDSGVGHFEHLL